MKDVYTSNGTDDIAYYETKTIEISPPEGAHIAKISYVTVYLDRIGELFSK